MHRKQPGLKKIPSGQPGRSSDDESDDSDEESDDSDYEIDDHEPPQFGETLTSLPTEIPSCFIPEVSKTSSTGSQQSVLSENMPCSEASLFRDVEISIAPAPVMYTDMDPMAMFNPYRECLARNIDPHKILSPILGKPTDYDMLPYMETPWIQDELRPNGDKFAHLEEPYLLVPVPVISKHNFDTAETTQTEKSSTPARQVQRAIPFRPSHNAPLRPPSDSIQRNCSSTKEVNFRTNYPQILMDTIHADMFNTNTEYIDTETDVETILLSRKNEEWGIEKRIEEIYREPTERIGIISTEESVWQEEDNNHCSIVDITEEAEEDFRRDTELTEDLDAISALPDPDILLPGLGVASHITGEHGISTHLEESDQLEGSQANVGISDLTNTQRPGEIRCEYELQPVPQRNSAPDDAAMEMSQPMATQIEEFSFSEIPESSAGEHLSMLDTEGELLPENASIDMTQTSEIPTLKLSRQLFTEDPTAGFSILSPNASTTVTADLLSQTDSVVKAQSPESGLSNWQNGTDEVDFSSLERTNMNIEGLRLCTFLHCPSAEALPALRLANAGFYYTSREGVVACYSCDLRCRPDDARLQGDPYAFHREMNQHCSHLNNMNQGYLFIQDQQSRAHSGRDITGSLGEETQRESVQGMIERVRGEMLTAFADFRRTPNAPLDNTDTREPRSAALPRPDDHDGPQSWAADVSARGATSTSPEEQAISGVSVSLSVAHNPSQEDEASFQPGQVESATPPEARDASAFDQNRAVHRRYSDVGTRERSFLGRWPDTHAQSPEELAVAGFFCAGPDDCVRCYYCDLGLRQWTPDDRPLLVHMRNSPHCGFMQTILGHPAITRTLAFMLGRMHGSRQDNSQATGGGIRRSDATTLNETQDTHAESPGELAGADFNGEAAATPLRNLVSTTNASGMLSYEEIELFLMPEEILLFQHLDYSDDELLDGIQALRESAGHRRVNVHDLQQTMDLLRERALQLDSSTSDNHSDISSDDSDDETVPDPSEMPHSVNAGDDDNDRNRGSSPAFPQGERGPQIIRQLEAENQELRRRRRCTVCLDQDISVLFLPCAHRVCCVQCAPALARCPVCRRRISSTVSVPFAGMPSGQQP